MTKEEAIKYLIVEWSEKHKSFHIDTLDVSLESASFPKLSAKRHIATSVYGVEDVARCSTSPFQRA